MSRPNPITDHTLQAIANLLWQFQDRPRLTELVNIFTAEIQDLEDLYNDLFDKRYLDNAEGAQLDVYGRIIGWPRYDFNDDDYRKLLKVGILANQTDSQIDEITYIISQLTEVPAWYVQRGQAHYSLTSLIPSDLSDEIMTIIISLMDRISPAGVSWEVILGLSGDQVFRFDTANQGYDQGKLADLIQNRV